MRFKFKNINDVLVSEKIANYVDFDTPSFKFCSLNWALKNTNSFCANIIKMAPIQGNHKYTIVDVKVHDLQIGVVPALPHWHLDCIGNPLDKRMEELHHLFITEGSLTEFPQNSIETEINPEERNFVLNHLPFIPVKIEPYRIYSYGRVPHRATPAYKNCKRLLIRVTETNVIAPRNSLFEPTYYTKGTV